MEKYGKCMVEIKQRVEAVNAILQERCTTISQATNIEFMCLQIRKILELIALGSLVTDEKEYKKKNSELNNNRLSASAKLCKIEEINPKFYHVPGKQVIDSQTGKVKGIIDITEEYLTREEFPGVYSACSGVIHSHPFKRSSECKLLENEIRIWITKIITLLNHHQIQLLNEKEQLWVVMHGPDGNVQTGLVERRDELPRPVSYT